MHICQVSKRILSANQYFSSVVSEMRNADGRVERLTDTTVNSEFVLSTLY
jgi:hypothetical protein